MANVVKTYELVGERKANRTPEEVTAERTLRFVMSSIDVDPERDVLYHNECPKRFSPLPSDPTLFCVEVEPQQNDEVEQVVDVVCRYSNRWDGGDGSEQSTSNFKHIENPLLRPAVITAGTYRSREVLDRDKDDKLFATTAGETIIHEEEVSRRMFSVTKNVTAVSSVFLKEIDFINSDAVEIYGNKFKPKTLWLTDIKVSPLKIENGYFYYVLSFSLYHNPKTWLVYKRNVGFIHVGRVRGVDGNWHLRTVPIKIGNPPEFPSVPLPLNNNPEIVQLSRWPYTHGTVRPEYLAVDPTVPVNQMNAAMGVGGVINPNKLKQIYEDTKLEFRTKELIRFRGSIPLQ